MTKDMQTLTAAYKKVSKQAEESLKEKNDLNTLFEKTEKGKLREKEAMDQKCKALQDILDDAMSKKNLFEGEVRAASAS